jgi:tetratricopeptide (TPR) repeat protein
MKRAIFLGVALLLPQVGFSEVVSSEACSQAPSLVLPSTHDLTIEKIKLPDSLPYLDDFVYLSSHIPIELWIVTSLTAFCVFLVASMFCFKVRVPVGLTVSTLGCLLLFSVISSAWLGVKLVSSRVADQKYQAALRLAQSLELPYRRLSWVSDWKRNPMRILAEVSAAGGIRTALEGHDTARALTLAEWLVPETSEGRAFRSAAFLTRAGEQLSGGQFPEALGSIQRALDADPKSRAAEDAIFVSRAHLSIDALKKGNFAEAKKNLAFVKRSWRPQVSLIIGSELALQQAYQVLDAKEPDYTRAYSVLDEAWDYVTVRGTAPVTLRCSLAAVSELRALQAFSEGNGSASTVYLARVDGLVEGSALTRELWPLALHLSGQQAIQDGRSLDAIASLQAALGTHPEKEQLPEIKRDLGRAWALQSDQKLNQREFSEALAAALQADQLLGLPETHDAVARVRVALADWSLCKGDWTAGRSQLDIVRAESSAFGSLANMRLAYVDGAPAQINRIARMARWIGAPAISGQFAVDRDEDGLADELVYCGQDGSPLAFSELNNRSEVVYVPSGPVKTSAIVRDADGDGTYDHAQIEQGDQATVILDVDADALPDLRLDYQGSHLVKTQAFSGQVQVRVLSAAIGGEPLDPPWAGPPDAYFVVAKNGTPLMRSSTVESRWPAWGEGVAVHYRYQDRLTISVFDEDVRFFFDDGDDFVGAAEFQHLPNSGYARTTNGNALLDVLVTPTTYPQGYRFTHAPMINAFLIEDPEVPEFRKIVEATRAIEAREEAYTLVSRIAASELLTLILVPRANVAVQLAVAVGLDLTVIEALYSMRR